MYATAYIWAKVLGYLERKLSEITVRAWLDDAELVALKNDQLIIYSPSEFRQEIIREKCAGYIQEALRDTFQIDAKLVVWGDSELHQYREDAKKDPIQFNPQFTFDSYITGDNNRVAVRIAQAATHDPGNEVYNPLFIYGSPGVGKTHLLYAIANQIQQQHPEKKVVYIKGDQFTNELVAAIRSGKTEAFKQKFRHGPDVLLVDDIQFISGKESTQEEFFHTFNELFERHKLIVMTADRKPAEMATLEDRLRSRFGAGIMVAIAPPDRQTRISIIHAKAQRLHLLLSEDIVSYMADTLTQNVRQIEGALKKLRAFRDLSAMELTLPNVVQTIDDHRCAEAKMPITATLIIRNVSRYFGLNEEILQSPQKSRGISEPRQIAMYLMRTLMDISFSDIGKAFGGRDHGTVHHAVRKIEAALTMEDSPMRGIIQDITDNIKNTVS